MLFLISVCEQLGCDHMCLSLGAGQGICECADGYYIDDDGKSCLCKCSFTFYNGKIKISLRFTTVIAPFPTIMYEVTVLDGMKGII